MLLTELLVEYGGEVEREAGEVEAVTGVFTVTESAMGVVIKRDICGPMWRREAAMHRGVEDLDRVGVLAPIRVASWLSEGKQG